MSTITLLYPGDMGSAFAKLLIAAGHKVVSPMGGRSEQTQETARSIGVEMRDDMASALAESDLVLSLVPPSAVIDVAEQAIAASREQIDAPAWVTSAFTAREWQAALRDVKRKGQPKIPAFLASVRSRTSVRTSSTARSRSSAAASSSSS